MLESKPQPRPMVLFQTPVVKTKKKTPSYRVLFEIIDIDGNGLTHYSGLFQAFWF